MRLPVLASATATNGAPISFSVKTLTGETFANLVTGETFTLEDARGTIKVFMLDKVGTTALTPADAVRVDISGDTTAADVVTTILTAINAAAIRMTAAEGAGDTLVITQDDPGPEGNTTSYDTVTDATFAIVDTTAVATAGAPLLRSHPRQTVDTFGETDIPYGFSQEQLDRDLLKVAINSTAGSGTMDVTIAVHLMHAQLGWENVGTLNDGAAIAETEADGIRKSFPICGLNGYTRIYYQITAINGTSTAVEGWLVGG